MIVTIIIFIAVLAVLVLVHEIGHFVTARLFGCGVEEFGLGFPPRLYGWKSPKTNILYSINAIPLGGFVKIKGEDGAERTDPTSFGAKPAWQRAIILVAGVTMNVVLAAVLLMIGFGVGLPTALPDDPALLAHARVRDTNIAMYQILPDSPAATAGFAAGDVVQMIDGQNFSDITAIQNYIAEHDGQAMTVTVERDDAMTDIAVTPTYQETTGRAGIGVALTKTAIVSYPWYWAIVKGVTATGSIMVAIVVAFYTIIKNLIVGLPAGVEVSGPVGIAVMTGQVVRLGWVHLLQFMALLSVNLAIINILPFPALDGGRLLFLAVEKLRRRPLDQRWEALVHNVGFLLLMLLILVVTYRDVVHFGGDMWRKVFG